MVDAGGSGKVSRLFAISSLSAFGPFVNRKWVLISTVWRAATPQYTAAIHRGGRRERVAVVGIKKTDCAKCTVGRGG